MRGEDVGFVIGWYKCDVFAWANGMQGVGALLVQYPISDNKTMSAGLLSNKPTRYVCFALILLAVGV